MLFSDNRDQVNMNDNGLSVAKLHFNWTGFFLLGITKKQVNTVGLCFAIDCVYNV